MLLMQREQKASVLPQWQYTAESIPEPNLPITEGGPPGCTFWLIGVEECMTMVVLCKCSTRN